jgi:hypothetical protein
LVGNRPHRLSTGALSHRLLAIALTDDPQFPPERSNAAISMLAPTCGAEHLGRPGYDGARGRDAADWRNLT